MSTIQDSLNDIFEQEKKENLKKHHEHNKELDDCFRLFKSTIVKTVANLIVLSNCDNSKIIKTNVDDVASVSFIYAALTLLNIPVDIGHEVYDYKYYNRQCLDDNDYTYGNVYNTVFYFNKSRGDQFSEESINLSNKIFEQVGINFENFSKEVISRIKLEGLQWKNEYPMFSNSPNPLVGKTVSHFDFIANSIKTARQKEDIRIINPDENANLASLIISDRLLNYRLNDQKTAENYSKDSPQKLSLFDHPLIRKSLALAIVLALIFLILI